MSSGAQDKSAECMEMGRPVGEHGLLKAFEGVWRAEVKMWWDPDGEPQVSTGRMTNRLVLNGLFLEQDYADDAGMFSGRGFWGYNAVDKRWEGFWIDTMSPMMQTEHGTHDEAKGQWTMVGQMTDPGTGKPLMKRSVITKHGEDRHTLEMYFSTPEGEKKGMEISYTRA